MRTIRGILAAVAIALPAAAQDDPFGPFEDPARTSDDLAGLLAGSGSALTGSGRWASYAKGIYLCSRESEDDRRKSLDEVVALQERGRELLVGLGAKVAADLPDAMVVRLAAAPGIVAVVPGKAILVRTAAGGTAAPAPVLRRRIDGAPLLRDYMPALRMARRWYGTLRDRGLVDGESGTLRHFLADRLVAASDLPAGTPAWFRAGLAGHVALKLRSGEPLLFTGNLPPGIAAGDKGALEKLLGDGEPSAEALPALARLVGSLLEGRTDLPALAGRLGGAAGLQARGAIVGKDLAALVAEAVKSLQPAGTKPAAVDGRVTCLLCSGTGRMELACGECGGMGGLGCPACGGQGTCWAGNCWKGSQAYEGGKKVRCKFCNGGSTTCKPCAGKRRVPCQACRGKGMEARPCLACVKGSLPAPGSAAGDACTTCAGRVKVPCSWCAKNDFSPACDACHGAGFLGCGTCFGTLRDLCGDCDGTGESRMVYADGSQASVTKCNGCAGRGFSDCRACKGGREDCIDCGGKGVSRGKQGGCLACAGSGTMSCPTCGPAPEAPAPSVAGAENAEANLVLQNKAVEFLLNSVGAGGAFCLRKKGTATAAGPPMEPSIFSNSQAIWALVVSGVPRDHPRIVAALSVLQRDAARTIASGGADTGVQETAFLLRAHLVAGGDPGGDVARKLAELVAAAQRPSGLWNNNLDGTGDEENILDSLIAIEALHVARSRGVKVPSTCWARAFSAGGAAFGARGPAKAGTGQLDAIDVASNLALIVISKAEMLGDKAATFDYLSIPDVRVGLAWLDRHFDITRVPVFVNGGKTHQKGGGCYFAWLFALQRLAMLLKIDEIGGENWHGSGAAHLRGLQRGDGSFEEKPPYGANWSVRSTTYALLFLVRATVPVTEPGASR